MRILVLILLGIITSLIIATEIKVIDKYRYLRDRKKEQYLIIVKRPLSRKTQEILVDYETFIGAQIGDFYFLFLNFLFTF